MAPFEGKTPAERNKMIAAVVFGCGALFLLARLFFGGSSTTTTKTNANGRQTARTTSGQASAARPEEQIDTPPEVVVIQKAVYTGGEPGRNIFAFYIPPPKPVAVPSDASAPPPTPTPPPPLMLASLSPQSVYAQTGDFNAQVSGDKFTPAVRVYVDGQEVPTQFVSPQQLTANVPAFLTTAPGARTVLVRTPDNLLYSNTATVNVMQPPVPIYTYIGYIGRKRNETAVLKDPQKPDLLSVQVNDLVGGRFRVTSISARAIELTDKDLKIKHTIAYTDARQAGASGPVPRGAIQPPPKAEGEEDEEP